MTTMTHRRPSREVFAGVDTHADTHHAGVVDALGRHLGDRESPASPHGYRQLLAWTATFGTMGRTGVEGTGAYGAGLIGVLTAAGHVVVEVNRPDRASRRASGKSDPPDAYAAAQAVASGRAQSIPKSHDGIVEGWFLTPLAESEGVIIVEDWAEIRWLHRSEGLGIKNTTGSKAGSLTMPTTTRTRSRPSDAPHQVHR